MIRRCPFYGATGKTVCVIRGVGHILRGPSPWKGSHYILRPPNCQISNSSTTSFTPFTRLVILSAS